MTEFVGQIIDIFENFLEEKGITTDNPERSGEKSACIIRGNDYGGLRDSIEELLTRGGITDTESAGEKEDGLQGCPVCGSQADMKVLWDLHGEKDRYYAECSNCRCPLSTRVFDCTDTVKEAVAQWNAVTAADERKNEGEIRWNGYGNGELYLLNTDGQIIYRVSEGDGSNLSHSDIPEGYQDYWMSEMYDLKKAGDRDRKATDGGQWLETEMIKETAYTVEGVIRRMMECDLYGNRSDWAIISAEYAEFLLDTQCRYRIGETYWATNPEAGRNAQSPSILTGWTADGKAILQNKRWGRIYATVRNLDEHN